MSYITQPQQGYGPSLLAVPYLRLLDSDERVAKYVDGKMLDWFIEEVIDPTKRLATSRRHAQSFIDRIVAEKVGFLKVQLVIEEMLGPGGIPLNLMLEYGWGKGGYEIWGNPWLAWTDYFGTHIIDTEKAGPVEHPGFRGYHLLDSITDWGFYDRFIQRITKESSEFMESVKFT